VLTAFLELVLEGLVSHLAMGLPADDLGRCSTSSRTPRPCGLAFFVGVLSHVITVKPATREVTAPLRYVLEMAKRFDRPWIGLPTRWPA
jgi:hypothetical protein